MLAMVMTSLGTVFAQDISQDSIDYPVTIILPNGDTIAAYTLDQELKMFRGLMQGEIDSINLISANDIIVSQDSLIEKIESKELLNSKLQLELLTQKEHTKSMIKDYEALIKNRESLNDILRKERKRAVTQRNLVITGGTILTIGLSGLLVWSLIK